MKSLIATFFFISLSISGFYAQQIEIESNLQAGGCENASVLYLATERGVSITSSSWMFINLDNGSISPVNATGISSLQVFTAPGRYEAVFTADLANGSTEVVKDTFTVWQDPRVGFDVSSNQGCPPLDVQFTDTSFTTDGSVITSRKWLWTDGTPETNSTLATERHTYTSSGLFNPILEVETDKGCSKAFTGVGAVFTFPKPNPSIFVRDGFDCRAPHTVTFENVGADTSNFNYTWDFGDGNRVDSDSLSLEYTFSTTGVFPIKLVATSNTGSCSDSVTTPRNEHVYIGFPSAETPELPDSICANSRINVSALPDSTGISTNQFWVLNGVNATSSRNFNRVISSPGEYEIEYFTYNTYSGCNSDTIRHKVVALPAPKAVFEVLNPRACKDEHELILVNKSTDYAFFNWIIDGVTIPGTTDTLRYEISGSGNHPISLIADNGVGCDNRANTQNANIRFPTVRDFEISPEDGCTPLEVTASPRFWEYNLQTDETKNYIFNWGNGVVDTVPTLTHKHFYTLADTFDITVTYLTSTGCSVTTDPIRIAIDSICSGGGGGGGGGGGSISIGVGPNGPDPCNNKYAFTFTNEIEASTLQYWDFEGVRVNNTNPVIHTFPNDGIKKSFLVTMMVRIDSTGQDIPFRRIVNVVDEVADFKLDTMNLCRNQDAVLTPVGIDSSLIDLYIWEYGDTTLADTIDNKMHYDEERFYLNGTTTYSYQDTGSYKVKLTIVDRNGCPSSKEIEPIKVFGPHAGFEFEVDPFCSSKFGVRFTDTSTFDQGRNLVRWNWDYGDGNTAEILVDSMPFHIFTDPTFVDTFSVKLTVEDNLGCSVTDSLPVGNPQDPRQPEAKFWIDTTQFCGQEGTITVVDKSIPFDLIPLVEKNWIWGDGNVENNLSDSVKHTYVNTSNTNSYELILQVVDSIGCVSYDTSVVSAGYPRARMNLNNQLLVCEQYTFNFINRSDANVSGPENIEWLASNGDLVTGSSPTFTFPSDTGTYSIQLKVTDVLGCQDSILNEDLIKIVRPIADFETGESPCPEGIMSFRNTSQYATSYRWNFGLDPDDFTNATSTAPIGVQYNLAGEYNIELIATGFGGRCVDTLLKPITIRGPRADLTTNRTFMCLGDSVSFEVTGTNIDKYFWSLGESILVPTTDSSVTYSYKNPGIYNPKVLLSSPDNCIFTLEVEELLVDSISAGPNANIECNADTAIISGYSFLNQSSYYWTGPQTASFIPDSSSLETVVNRVGLYILQSDSAGCSMTDTVEVTTSGEFPVIDAGLDQKISCISKDTAIQGQITSLFSDASWIFVPEMDTTFVGNNVSFKVNKPGEYVFRVRDRECISFDTLQIAPCNLLLKDTTFALCANVNEIKPTYSSYNLRTLEDFILDENLSSEIQWFIDSNFVSPISSPDMINLTDSIPFYVRVVSNDGTEVARAEVFPVIHDYVEVDFNEIENTCASEDTLQITGMTPSGGEFIVESYLNAQGQFVAPLDSGLYEVTYTFKSPEGCADSLTKMARVIEVPLKPIVSDLIYCQGVEELPSFDIDLLPEHKVFWYDDTIKNPLSGSPNLRRKVDSVFYFVSQKNSLCESDRETVLVRVDSTPEARIVLGESYLCEGFQSVFKTEGLKNSTFLWNLESDSVFTFVVSDSDTLSYKIGSGEINGWVVETTEKECRGDTSYFNVNADLKPRSSLILSTYDTCQMADTVEVITNTLRERERGEWLGITPKGDSSFWYLDANVLPLGSNSLVWKVDNPSCPATESRVSLTIDPMILPQISLTELNPKCVEDSALFVAEVQDAGETPELSWIFNGVPLEEENDSLLLNKVQESGIVKVSVTSSERCAFPKNADDEAVLKVIQPPSPQLSQSGDLEICVTSPLSLTLLENVTVPDGTSYQWYLDDELISDKKNLDAPVSVSGEYKVEVNYNDGVCGSRISEPLFLDVSQVPYVDASANGINPVVGFEDEEMTLEGFHSGDYAVWKTRYDKEIVYDTTDLYSRIMVEENAGFYWVDLVAHEGSCKASDSVYVIIKKPVKAPNVFTPNNDGENDVFVILGLEFYKESKVTVFNRWGVPVYETLNYPREPWDGRNVPDGVYYYTVEYTEWDDEISTHTGVIHVVR